VVHHLVLARAGASRQVFEGDAVQDGGDCAFQFRPDGLEVARILSIAHVRKIAGIETRELNERSADTAYDITDRDLAGMPCEDIASLGAALTTNDINSFQDLHDLEEKLYRDAVPFGDVLNTDGSVALEVQGQFEHCGARIFFFRGYLHACPE
jgi:hypothetical protein